MSDTTETSLDITAILGVVAASITVLKEAYELGVEMWPKISIIINNIDKLITAYSTGTPISDDDLAAMQAETDSLSEECNNLFLAKFGDPT